MLQIVDYKRFAAAVVILFSIWPEGVLAQANESELVIEVTFNKTSSLVLPHPVTAVDRGSRDLLVQKVSGARNILYLKAARPAFSETNLTVITGDGSIREFTVVYSARPAEMITRIDEVKDRMPDIVFDAAVSEVDLARYVSVILESAKKGKRCHDKNGGVRLALKNISIAQNVLFFHIEITNRSHVGYNTDLFRFFIEDRKQVRRTATQKRDLLPVYTSDDLDTVPGKARVNAVFAFDKFTIPDAKRLVIEVFEHNGGRHLQLNIPNRVLVRARPL